MFLSIGKQSVEEMNHENTARNGNSNSKESSPIIDNDDSDMDMDTSEEIQNGHGDTCINGNLKTNNGYQNGTSNCDGVNKVAQELSICCDNDDDEDMGELI